MRLTKSFGNILTRLKNRFNKPSPESYQIKTLQEQIQKLQDVVSSIQNTMGVIAKFSASQIVKQTKHEDIHAAMIKIISQHESELEGFKNLLNQHADVINLLRKQIYKDILIEEDKKDLDESSENSSFLEIKKKINKDN